MVKIDNLILGSGIAGLAAGQKLAEQNRDYLIIEKEKDYGGLCSSFKVDGFIFEHFIHLSFTTDNFVRSYMDQTPYYTHTPNPFNYYRGTWIKHPAINNLFPLSEDEKERVLTGLADRERYRSSYTDNYEQWLRYQFGDYFAENFPLVYTRKYWAEEARNMETKWVGNRVYQPTMDEILAGMKTTDTPVTYYAKEMRYPKRGGYSEYLKSFANAARIRTGENVIRIDAENKIVETDKEIYQYKMLYSSIPLPEMAEIQNCGNEFGDAVKGLHWTSGYIVSIGLKGELSRPDLWDYVYDEDIVVSRFYSPSLMSPATVPDGCSSIQAEIYTKDGRRVDNEEELLKKTIEQMTAMGVIDKAAVIVKDIRFAKYCNILFDHNVYERRKAALDIIKAVGIIPIGRFGRWEYLWSDQAFMSGYSAIDEE